MAKINPKFKQVAQRGGVRIPPGPRIPVKTPEQLKQQAQARAKARAKRLVKLLIVTAILAVVALAVYFVKFYGKMPKDALKQCIEYAYKDNTMKFRDCFTTDSIDMVESIADSSPDDAWEHLIDGITPTHKPEIKDQKITEDKGFKSAEITLNIDGDMRTLYMRNEDGKWKINLNVAINPRKITLPENLPPDYIDNFQNADEAEAWWEEDEEKKNTEKSSGFLSKFNFRKFFRSS